jgi:hypothetical protein
MEYRHQSASLGLPYHNLAMLEEHEAVYNFPITTTYLANAISLSATMVSHLRHEHQSIQLKSVRISPSRSSTSSVRIIRACLAVGLLFTRSQPYTLFTLFATLYSCKPHRSRFSSRGYAVFLGQTQDTRRADDLL